MRAAPRFFWVCVGMVLVNNIPARNIRAAKLVVLLSTCERESVSEVGERWHDFGLPLPSSIFQPVSA